MTRSNILEVNWDRGVRSAIAHEASDQPGFSAKSNAILAEVRAAAAPHVKTGAMMASIHLSHGSVDDFVYMDPAPPGRAHAELGHRQGHTLVRGIHVFSSVVRAHGGV